MASWESRFWPVRRWLADRLVGDHAYSKNVAVTPAEWADRLRPRTVNAATVKYVDAYGDEWLVPVPPPDVPRRGPGAKRWFDSLPASSRISTRNPGETA
jgi:hypothetical protein